MRIGAGSIFGTPSGGTVAGARDGNGLSASRAPLIELTGSPSATDMIEKRNLISNLLRRLQALPDGHCLDVRSYKRDRGFMLIRLDADTTRVVEDGFEKQRLDVAAGDLKKTLKEMVKREFPRSNKLRVYDLGEYEEGAEAMPRKVL